MSVAMRIIAVCVFIFYSDKVHSFTGSTADVKSFLELDLYFSINGW